MIDVPHVGVYGYMPLSVIRGRQPVISGTDIELTYFVINPYSSRADVAIEFVKNYVNNWSDRTKIVLLKSAAHPVERSSYDAEKAAIQDEIRLLQTQLLNDEAIEIPDVRQSLADMERVLIDCEESRWDITQEEIDWYQSVVDSIVISKLNPIALLKENQPNLFKRLQGSGMDVQRFLELLDEKVRSINLEVQ